MLWLGREGQDAYGRKNFLDLISVFTAPPLFTVLHGRRELGFVDESTFLASREDGPPVLLLAGRAWRVGHLDWKRRRAHVEPAEDVGRSRWRGEGQFLGRELCGAIRRTLAGGRGLARAGRRRAVRRDGGRPRRVPLADARTTRTSSSPSDGDTAWWTFGGGRANAALAHELARRTGRPGRRPTTSPSGSRRSSTPSVVEQQVRGLARCGPGRDRAPGERAGPGRAEVLRVPAPRAGHPRGPGTALRRQGRGRGAGKAHADRVRMLIDLGLPSRDPSSNPQGTATTGRSPVQDAERPRARPRPQRLHRRLGRASPDA